MHSFFFIFFVAANAILKQFCVCESINFSFFSKEIVINILNCFGFGLKFIKPNIGIIGGHRYPAVFRRGKL